MDDSGQDFVDLCSKLLKRVRKKPAEARQQRKAEQQQQQQQPCSQASDGDKRRRNNKRDGDSGSSCAGSQPVCTEGAEAAQPAVCGGTGCDSGDAGPSVVSAAAGQGAERGLSAKDKVLHRMQQFKRASPQRMGRKDKSQPDIRENDCAPPAPSVQRRDPPESLSSGLQPEPQDSDEALALRLQQELDREAAEVRTVDLEDGGLFFCHICQRDVTHMSPEGRTQHVNRCLDESEESAPPPPPPAPAAPGVPDCPICGKKFKSQKSRSAHLKRCSSDMGVPPAVLLQALQRQAEEAQNIPAANTLTETGGTKRKGPSKPGLPAKKKPRKKAEPLDEDTMVALALSSSLLEQERESQRQLGTAPAASHVSSTPVLKWRPDAGKGRGRRKKGAVPRPPPLLLVQDAEAALTRLQERVSALLLRSRPPSPPTPTRCPSSLPGWSGAAPLWRMSSLLDATCLLDFYTPELREFITPWESTKPDAASSCTTNKPESSVQPVSEGAPVAGTDVLPPSAQTAPTSPGTEQLPVGSQILRDLMELAEDGMTPTQCGRTASGPDKEKSVGLIMNLHLSGFVPEEQEEQAELCVSGFLPGTTCAPSEKTHRRATRTDQSVAAYKERGGHGSVALSRLASDLSGMVNNPQLSDVQLQVDTGEVYFAHSFMVYARCPLLAEMVHESGFGVREEGMAAAQRVLMTDVPGQAVFALLQYLYTADCSVPASLWPHVLELAARFDLQELQQLCELRQEDAVARGDEEDYNMNQEENVNNQTDQAFLELLRSMWNEEEEDTEGADTDERSDEERRAEEDRQADDLTTRDQDIREEKVNEEELEEIYEFAATQRMREVENDSTEEEEEENGEEVFTKPPDPKRSSAGFSVRNLRPNSQLEPDPSLDRSYSRLFSDSWGVYEEGDPSSLPSTSCQPKTRTPQSPHKPVSEPGGTALLQSSPSLVDDLSLSPPASTSNLPIPGPSPGQVDNLDLPEGGLRLTGESQGPRGLCVPVSPGLPSKKKEPELIVLSDSSEEMEVVLSSRSPSPCSPGPVQSHQSYTHIKPQPVPRANEPVTEDKKSGSVECSPAAPGRSHPGPRCDPSPVDCSPEVSWLIPSTPLQHGQSTTSSSTQTRSSICRTRLFPKGDSSSSSVFSPPALPFGSRPQTCTSPAGVGAHVGPEEGSIPGLKLEETDFCIDHNFSPKRTSSSDPSEVRERFAVPLSLSKRLQASSSISSKQDTPVHLQPKPHSSTPLHTELLQPPVLLDTSPLHSSLDEQRLTSQGGDGAPSDSPEKTELGSFHLSPLSDPSDPPSSSAQRGHSDSSRQSRRSVGSSTHDSTGGELTRRGVRDEGGGMECENKDATDDDAAGDAGVTEAAESSFQQSFMAMDEPPIAFNDSWGLDACVDANPGCFSLRLEDSRGSSQHEISTRQHDTARTSSSADGQASPASHGVRFLSSRGSVTAASPAKAHSTHPLTNGRAHTGPSFTPSPPEPTTRTPPEVSNSLLDSKIWDSWEEEEEEEALPLSQRVNPSAHLKTPVSSHNKRRRTLVPITPMPHYSDMDTPELKNKLNRFGVRPLPKRQMILKLKEIHHYTHQLVSSDSEEEAPSAGPAAQTKGPPSIGNRPLSCAQTVKFKEPRAPAAATSSPLKHNREEEEAEPLSASQGSNSSSAAASEESERSNPELCPSSDGDSDSDGGISASQVASRLQDRLRAVRSFILSDSELYTQILQYQPLVLSQLQQQLKVAGIRLGAAKLADYLDSQCITFTTAKPGHSVPSRRRGRRAKAAGESGASRKRGITAMQ